MDKTVVIGGDSSLIQKVDGECSLSVGIDGVSGIVIPVEPHARPTYEGDYIVTPMVTEQILETQDKVMRSDLTVKEIPTYAVSNESGGNTFIIG